MGTVLCKLFSYIYTISLLHSSRVVNVLFRFVSYSYTSVVQLCKELSNCKSFRHSNFLAISVIIRKL